MLYKKKNITKKYFLQKKSKFFTKHRYSNFFCFKKKNELKSFYFKKKKEKKASVSLYLDQFIKTNLNLKYSSIKINFNTKTTLTTKKYLFLHKNLLKINFNKLIIKSKQFKIINLLKNIKKKNIKKKKIFLFKFFKQNLFFFHREKKILYYNKFYLNFFNYRMLKKKKNYTRNNLINLRYLSRILRKI